MRINLTKELVVELLTKEDFYNLVPEFFFLKENGARIAEAIAAPGGCTSCTERNLIEPTVLTFISHLINMYLDCGKISTVKFKEYIKNINSIQEDFEIVTLYKENEESDVVEILI